jgi:hypothetical protein
MALMRMRRMRMSNKENDLNSNTVFLFLLLVSLPDLQCSNYLCLNESRHTLGK